jgi:hypothetical protein
MNEELIFYRMNPSDSLLSGHHPKKVWCLSEPGEQYLIFSTNGNHFELQLTPGKYDQNQWMDAKTGARIELPEIKTEGLERLKFTPPDSSTDWVLLITSSGQRSLLIQVH